MKKRNQTHTFHLNSRGMSLVEVVVGCVMGVMVTGAVAGMMASSAGSNGMLTAMNDALEEVASAKMFMSRARNCNATIKTFKVNDGGNILLTNFDFNGRQENTMIQVSEFNMSAGPSVVMKYNVGGVGNLKITNAFFTNFTKIADPVVNSDGLVTRPGKWIADLAVTYSYKDSAFGTYRLPMEFLTDGRQKLYVLPDGTLNACVDVYEEIAVSPDPPSTVVPGFRNEGYCQDPVTGDIDVWLVSGKTNDVPPNVRYNYMGAGKTARSSWVDVSMTTGDPVNGYSRTVSPDGKLCAFRTADVPHAAGTGATYVNP